MLRFGIKGPRGNDGDAGAAGAQGDAGVQGEQGIQGDAGAQGEQGVQGDAGAAGTFNYTDRGNLANYDFNKDTLIEDGAWHDMDLASIVGAGIRLVLLKVVVGHTTVGEPGNLRTKGYTGSANVAVIRAQEAGYDNISDMWVLTDASGVIQYMFSNTTWAKIDIAVRGWCVP